MRDGAAATAVRSLQIVFELNATSIGSESQMTTICYRPFRTRPWFLLLTLVASGCGRSGPALFPVSGTVSYNGAPVPEGSIVFMAADNRIAADAGTIHDGRFDFQAKEGKKLVAVRAVRNVGAVIPSMGVPARESYIPAEYNTNTTLTAEVVRGGDNHFVFDLKESSK